MQKRLGPDFDAFRESMSDPIPVSIRYNTRKLQLPDGHVIPWCPDGRYLGKRPSFTLDPLFHAGGYYVQEASSMLLEQAVRQSIDLTTPQVALDLCAAPGGKSTHLLSLLSDDSLLIANEVIRSRASVLMENIEKWGRDNVIVTNNDPADFGRLEEFFDLVLVDAPCSGEGLFRKEPEAMHEWSMKNVNLCALRQRRIISDIWLSLKPGGILIYSTCTYNDQENIGNLAWLAGQHDLTFETIMLDPAWGVTVVNQGLAIGYQCFPNKVTGEGFFFSVIRKSGAHQKKKMHVKDKLKYPTTADKEQVKTWITKPGDSLFFLHEQQIRMIPLFLKNELLLALDKLHVIQAGTAVGEIMKNRIVPDHGLALSIYRSTSSLPGIALDASQARDYLRKNPLNLPEHDTGFHAVEFQGLGLGWVNILTGRMNNLFPAGRRIRMTDDKLG